MTSSLGTARARLRMQLTGETFQQARELVAGRPDVIADAAHRDQIALEGAILSELDELYAGEEHPLEGCVYGITRIRPTRESITLHLADDAWEAVLEWLLPVPEPDLGIDGLSVSGVVGLRARPRPPHRIELFRPGRRALITLQLPPDDAPDAYRRLSDLPRTQDPIRTAPDWTPAERASIAAYEAQSDPAPRSALLRRLMAFRNLPVVRLVEDTSGEVPGGGDFQQLLVARARPAPRPTVVPRPALSSLPAVAGQGPVVLAVVSGHTIHGQAMGGLGRTTVAARLAAALAEQGQRVLLVDIDPARPLAEGRSERRRLTGVEVAHVTTEPTALGEALRERAAGRDSCSSTPPPARRRRSPPRLTAGSASPPCGTVPATITRCSPPRSSAPTADCCPTGGRRGG
ncbi:AAA family ATPase [Streptomyces inusitatus]